jgi:hypothetical protein
MLNRDTQALEVLAEEALGLVLRDVEHEGVPGVEHAEVGPHEEPRAGVQADRAHRVAAGKELLDQPGAVQHLQGPGVQNQGPALQAARGALLDDADSGAASGQLGGQEEAGRASAHDKDRVGLGFPSHDQRYGPTQAGGSIPGVASSSGRVAVGHGGSDAAAALAFGSGGPGSDRLTSRRPPSP